MIPELELYYKEIEDTNKKIGCGLTWDEYTERFKKVNPKLYDSLKNVNIRRVNNLYLKNWIRNLTEGDRK